MNRTLRGGRGEQGASQRVKLFPCPEQRLSFSVWRVVRRMEIMTLPALVRDATLSDADDISDVYLASCKRFLPYAPLSHTDENLRHM